MTTLPARMQRRVDAKAAERRAELASYHRARTLVDAMRQGGRLLWPSGVPWLGSGR